MNAVDLFILSFPCKCDLWESGLFLSARSNAKLFMFFSFLLQWECTCIHACLLTTNLLPYISFCHFHLRFCDALVWILNFNLQLLCTFHKAYTYCDDSPFPFSLIKAFAWQIYALCVARTAVYLPQHWRHVQHSTSFCWILCLFNLWV